ncbi:MAG: tryptophan 7-halogenase [Burkholderiales bacterium]|nr:tryptophan 7-halogenase [Burkholderiales bacterium]
MRVNDDVRHVVILGGGSAGWLTAALLAREHHAGEPDGLAVTLIESPNTPPIGVGEGTWPSMRDTLRRIGFSETTLVRECDASFKQGSLFRGWMRGRAAVEGDQYRHPFTLPMGFGDVDLVAGWLQRHGDRPFAEVVSAQPHVCMAGHAPKQFATPEFAAVANYGYHFDAGKFGVQLREHAVAHLHVRHVLDDVDQVLSHDDGDIAALRTRRHGDIAGDLFIDCSGMASVLLGQHYGVGVRSCKHLLFNDTALALQVPYPAADTPIACETIATAQPAGWTWDIGLHDRRGVGHVYSSAHTSHEEAERQLLAHVRATGGSGELPAPRRIAFEPGWRERSWHRNCIAVGLSAGFVEPLEASALALVELSAATISDEMPATRAEMALVEKRFNDAFAYRWERVVDFLKLHYALSRRDDTDYWRAHRERATLPDRLADLLTLWRHRAPYRQDFFRIEEVFPAASYQYVAHGMGLLPEPSARTRHPSLGEAAEPYFRETAHLARRMLGALPLQRSLIDHIRAHGLPRG